MTSMDGYDDHSMFDELNSLIDPSDLEDDSFNESFDDMGHDHPFADPFVDPIADDPAVNIPDDGLPVVPDLHDHPIDPTTHDPAVQDPTVQDPAVADPNMVDPDTVDIDDADPGHADPAPAPEVHDPTTHDPTTHDPVIDAPAPDPGPESDPSLDVPAPGEEPALDDDGVYGNSYEWNSDWFYQQVDGYCGPTSVAIIANEFSDAGITDPQVMVDQAYNMGLTQDISEGLYMEDIQTLLDASGVPCETVTSSMDDLAARLDAGCGVIAAVDSGELWGDSADAAGEDNMPDHALVVTEIDTNTGMVTLEDPGNPDGNGTQVPISQFEDAWADSGFQMVATTEGDPDLGGTSDNPQLAFVNVTGSDVIQ